LVQDDAQLGKGGLVPPGSRLGGLLPGTPARRRQVVQDLSDAGAGAIAAVSGLYNLIQTGTTDRSGCTGFSLCAGQQLWRRLTTPRTPEDRPMPPAPQRPTPTTSTPTTPTPTLLQQGRAWLDQHVTRPLGTFFHNLTGGR
ncbi:MAG TPA: hypothetical protein VKP11_08070, partial [Frankiaceae bacterium]|nr:hypothetical protein [Frankiaceae bacterium]